jgi:hypothetical protein
MTWQSQGIDKSVPNVARMYDDMFHVKTRCCLLAGKPASPPTADCYTFL